MLFFTRRQYFCRLLIRNVFPHLIMTKKTALAARPMNAAETKQFWYPRLSSQGVILSHLTVS